MELSGILTGLITIVMFVLSVWAIARILNSSATTGKKALWIILILFLPLIGLIAWYFAGPKG